MISTKELPILSDFGSRLRWARERAGFSQKILGDLTGYTQKQISNMEAGITERPRKIKNLSDSLEVSPAWLMFGIEQIDALDSRTIELALKFNKLKKGHKSAIESLAHTFLSED